MMLAESVGLLIPSQCWSRCDGTDGVHWHAFQKRCPQKLCTSESQKRLVLPRSTNVGGRSHFKHKAKYKDDVIGIRVLGGFLIDFYNHANIIATGQTPYKLKLLEIKSCFKSITDDDEACFKVVLKLGLDRLGSTTATTFCAYVSN